LQRSKDCFQLGEHPLHEQLGKWTTVQLARIDLTTTAASSTHEVSPVYSNSDPFIKMSEMAPSAGPKKFSQGINHCDVMRAICNAVAQIPIAVVSSAKGQ